MVNPYAEQLTFLDDKTRTRRDHQKYLTLIDTIACCTSTSVKIHSIERNGQVIEYIEATLDDIAVANRLAHEVLGRSLDELPPQTRRLLTMICALVDENIRPKPSNEPLIALAAARSVSLPAGAIPSSRCT